MSCARTMPAPGSTNTGLCESESFTQLSVSAAYLGSFFVKSMSKWEGDYICYPSLRPASLISTRYPPPVYKN
ncbi:hypothetical protein E2986_13056 [Frieseomelitta varia]|uniref:Uncharacterized protein n=1 Tax=Frieseomelitta varia TaxID=561572 RepID=A0A833RQQ5_9HYME|nr:hypothetical protein E2986_13056 [Frieseomelitta varia]